MAGPPAVKRRPRGAGHGFAMKKSTVRNLWGACIDDDIVGTVGVIALSFSDSLMLILRTSYMPQPASAPLEDGVLDVLRSVSRRPIEPSLTSDLVADLGFDSLQILEVVAELEDRFDISIPLNDVPSTRTVAQVVAQVARLVEEKPAS